MGDAATGSTFKAFRLGTYGVAWNDIFIFESNVYVGSLHGTSVQFMRAKRNNAKFMVAHVAFR